MSVTRGAGLYLLSKANAADYDGRPGTLKTPIRITSEADWLKLLGKGS